MSEIVWTKTDESPFVASVSLLPILKCILNRAKIKLKVVDISLSGRILAAFNYADDGLKILGELTKQKDANIIKLPNISATIPQLKAAILELKNAGFDLPDYENNPKIYAPILGSAVNPVIREGNSDRKSTKAVKDYAKNNPHFMGEWDAKNRAEICSMNSGDFYENERSFIAQKDEILKIKFIDKNGKETLLKDDIKLSVGDIFDASFLSVDSLYKFYENEFKDAKEKDLLLSLHLKASMMKVSDPVIFGYALKAFFKPVFDEFKDEFKRLDIRGENGLKDIFLKLENSPKKDEIMAKFSQCFKENADVAMVDFKNGVTNFHVPSDVIIDASMPQMLRNSGQMIDKNGNFKATKALIPDRTYAGVYKAALDDFKERGKLDVRSIGSVSNIGLMAKKAQEYGSHDKSFIAENDGEFVVFSDNEYLKFSVKKGDIFRACIAKDEAIKNWINLAINRAKTSDNLTIFWLDESRASDKNMIQIVTPYIKNIKNIEILNPQKACLKTLSEIRNGKDVVSVTGNVLRDYLTDLYPILELGTSAKMLSIVPLLNGGGLFETGAGGTAPLLTKELLEQNHIIWDSLGEFLALNASLEFYATNCNNKEALILAKALDNAISQYLKTNSSPKPEVGKNDTRASHFLLALFWLNELKNGELAEIYADLADFLTANKDEILAQLNANQGQKVELGGWYFLNEKVVAKTLRPSEILNSRIEL
ncbi:NADP-dependent isocitrate dehydrogenase [Campylobacter gastrosuis]|uniref:isocitrate dehydrogenase (NADP(+)) n=1 Tax=Campylobacter gastrosuis TaxID=2974576 RepID=A0ABT7HNQ9_9BACT|nr:NADP-dependent isocitrate dehydrogenase [Campylobacter gastrosuis]MDL0088263.1 NADP-dependent isocitrate dehydrogenase [Campylobacter gastrosuis]